VKGIRRIPCYCCSITKNNLAKVFYTTENRHIQPEVLILLIFHFSKCPFDWTVQINVLDVLGSDVQQVKI